MIYCEAQPYQNADDPSVHPVFRGKKHIHLFADCKAELLLYALETLGMKEGWLQNSRGFIHFDVTGYRMNKVLKDPKVIKLSREEFVQKVKEMLSL